MLTLVVKLLTETLQITLLVAVMMIAVDLLNVWTKRRITTFFQGKSKFRQYVLSSMIGTVPGCIGGFTNVSLYMHGLISFGALSGSMIAVSGDEAFVMLAMFPQKAVLLFAILFVVGTFGGWFIDTVVKRFHIKTCENCDKMITHSTQRNLSHYFKVHIYEHIIKRHLWKTALWTFGALAVVEFGLQYLHLEEFTSQYRIAFLFLGALVGLIPESGPHLIFVSLFSKGLIPFSVLLTSSMVQDGHGMLPLLSFSLKDSINIKLFNLLLGLIVGLAFLAVGY
ncbi:MAG: selenocysteine protein [Ignavibacteriales bacterium CG07_land_8_20_14_0_80_59_12]|nr:MAG: selenocysteine protein [Ignavibacteriales bacterium CG07_land_8_20_14_0_80_59_12]